MCLLISDSVRVMSLQEKWTYEGLASLVILFFFTHLCYSLVVSLTVLDHLIGKRLKGLEKCYVLVIWIVTLTDWWRTILTYVL